MKINFLAINKENIDKRPDKFITTINNIDFIFEISWNPEVEGFFCNLYSSNEEPILLGKRIIYNEDILANIINDSLASVKIIPLDKTGFSEKEGITFNNFITNVKLYIFVGDN